MNYPRYGLTIGCTSYFHCFYFFLMLSKLKIHRSSIDESYDIKKWSKILRYFQDYKNISYEMNYED